MNVDRLRNRLDNIQRRIEIMFNRFIPSVYRSMPRLQYVLDRGALNFDYEAFFKELI